MKIIIFHFVGEHSSEIFKLLYEMYWPITILIIACMFRKQIMSLMPNLRLKTSFVDIDFGGMVNKGITSSTRVIKDTDKILNQEAIISYNDIKTNYNNTNIVKFDVSENHDLASAANILIQAGIVVKDELDRFTADKNINNTLSKIYIQLLNRDKTLPLDPSGYSTWGSFLYKYGVSKDNIEYVELQIKKSAEYLAKYK